MFFNLLLKFKIGKDMVKLDNTQNVPECDEEMLMKAVAHQPVATGVQFGGHDLQFYSQVITNNH